MRSGESERVRKEGGESPGVRLISDDVSLISQIWGGG